MQRLVTSVLACLKMGVAKREGRNHMRRRGGVWQPAVGGDGGRDGRGRGLQGSSGGRASERLVARCWPAALRRRDARARRKNQFERSHWPGLRLV